MKKWYERLKKKLPLLGLLPVAAILLGGCTAWMPLVPTEEPASVPETTDAPTEESMASRKIEFADYSGEWDWEVSLPAPVDGKYYFTCSNYDLDYYKDCLSCSFNFFIFSKVHYDPEEIQVKLPIASDYEVNIVEDPSLRGDFFDDQGAPKGTALQYYIYQNTQGMDWAELRTLTDIYDYIGEWENMPEDILEKYPTREAAASQYETLKNRDWDGFLSMKDTLPEFYVYPVLVSFWGYGDDSLTLEDESFREITITMGEDTYTQEIGEVRLHTDKPPVEWQPKGVKSLQLMSGESLSNPWTANQFYCTGSFAIRTLDDVTLTGIRFLNEQVEALGAELQIMNPEGTEASSVVYWDGKMPYDMEKGTTVQINLYLSDPGMRKYEYGKILYIYLDYEVNGQSYSVRSEMNNIRIGRSPWETYYTVFEGMDFESFYRDYYVYLDERWRGNLS